MLADTEIPWLGVHETYKQIMKCCECIGFVSGGSSMVLYLIALSSILKRTISGPGAESTEPISKF